MVISAIPPVPLPEILVSVTYEYVTEPDSGVYNVPGVIPPLSTVSNTPYLVDVTVPCTLSLALVTTVPLVKL